MGAAIMIGKLTPIATMTVLGIVGLSLPATADDGPDKRTVPSIKAICDTTTMTVKPELLAEHLLTLHPMSARLQAIQFPPPSDPRYGPERWRQYITDPKLLTNPNICPKDPTAKCLQADRDNVLEIQIDFAAFMSQGTRQGDYRTDASNLSAETYFANVAHGPVIACIKEPPPAPPANNTDKSPIRVRGIASDLYVGRDSAAFATTSKATVTVTSDTSAKPWTESTKLQGAVGYAIDAGSSQDVIATIVPFVAGNISVTDTQAKPRTEAAYNFVSGGALFTADVGGLDYITVMPQYLDETTQHAQLASLRAIYQPWTNAAASAPFLPLNTAVPLPFAPTVSGQFLFDLRADVGTYTDRGLPAYVAQNKDFGRLGTKTGFAFTSTQQAIPSYTFVITETLLYGVAGSLRNLNLLETSLTIGLDSHSYFGITFGYTNGFNEDTAVREQTWTLGLSGHY
jgi:hypothetical protein